VKHALLIDRDGVIYKGRKSGMNQWKSAHAIETKDRTLEDALRGADVFFGLSGKGAVTKDMIKTMAKDPIIFAMANPDPEILPEEVREVRPDAIIATGRSDYPNQVNNVMGFPYIFRGALDVGATEINEEMKIAAAHAIAMLAREEVPEEVSSAYSGRKMRYGKDYIIPVPFDPRLITTVPPAVARAAMESGVARKPIHNIAEYRMQLRARLDPSANSLSLIFERVKENPKRVIFSEGEEEKMILAAVQWRENGYGVPVLVGREKLINETMDRLNIADRSGIEISNAAINPRVDDYIEYLYNRLQRQGFLHRDVVRMVKNDRNTYAACMVACGDGDALVTGLTRNYSVSLEGITQVIPTRPHCQLFGLSMVITKKGMIFISDTAVNELPNAKEMADIAEQTAAIARHMGYTPRVALLSFSNFGNPIREKTLRIREAVEELDARVVDFEYEGEMSPDVALDPEMLKLYPFARLSGPANVLVMPALHSAHISSYLLQELGGSTVIGPLVVGLEHSAQVVQMGASVSEILNLAALAAAGVGVEKHSDDHHKKVTRLRKQAG
jgi:malate dehydrogenase (oxaloacetate-decarboxylating)(NADP+)